MSPQADQLHSSLHVTGGTMLALVLATSHTARADEVILYQNGFESGDTCAWTAAEPEATCDLEMVFVPAGQFTMGSESGDPDEKPVHVVTLSNFWIDRLHVTVDQYAACITAGGCEPPDAVYDENTASGCNWGAPWSPGDHPINCVDWFKARDYCLWASKRLLTEAEWEKASRGTDQRTYPWGDQAPTCDYAVMNDGDVNGGGCGQNHTDPVGTKRAGASPYGALDMVGNVWGWVNDWYDPAYYGVSPATDPPGPPSSPGVKRTLRGGSWGSTGVGDLRSADRDRGLTTDWYDEVGFRCGRDG